MHLCITQVGYISQLRAAEAETRLCWMRFTFRKFAAFTDVVRKQMKAQSIIICFHTTSVKAVIVSDFGLDLHLH